MKLNSYDILFVLGSLDIGGVEKINISIANYLSNNYKKKICIVALTNINPILKSLISKKVDLIIFNKSRVYMACLDFLFLIKKIKPKIIFSSLNYINIFTLLIGKISLTKSKIIISERINVEKEIVNLNDNIKNKIITFFYKLFLLRIYNQSDLIHCISKGVKESLHKSYGVNKKIMKVIYNPIIFSQVDEKQMINKITKISDFVNILSVGRLHKQKDLNTLIKSLVLLKNKINFHLHIVGGGPELNNLINLSKKLNLSQNITFVGQVRDPSPYYEMADIFVLSSIWEGLGNVIIEALSFNCKVISSDCESGPREILEDGKWGKLFPVKDHISLAKAIIEVSNNNVYQNCRIRSKDFSIKKIGAQYNQMFDEILKPEYV